MRKTIEFDGSNSRKTENHKAENRNAGNISHVGRITNKFIQ